MVLPCPALASLRYAAAEGAAEAMNNVYASLATYLSAEQHEVALVDSSTTAFAKALYSTKLERGVSYKVLKGK